MKPKRAISLLPAWLVFLFGPETSAPAQFTFVTAGHATNRPPVTAYANDVVSNYLGFVLQQNSSLGPLGWGDVAAPPVMV
jgi:hypothetical protein